jgi:hypothetical protein
VSLAISLPTMLVGFARYGRDRSFAVLGTYRIFWLWMAAGSIVGAASAAWRWAGCLERCCYPLWPSLCAFQRSKLGIIKPLGATSKGAFMALLFSMPKVTMESKRCIQAVDFH